MRKDYSELLLKKKHATIDAASVRDANIHQSLFPFQRDCVEKLLAIGRGAAFLDTGLGKTIIQCEWARHVPGDVIIAAPLAVANQTVREARDKLDMEICYSKDGTVGGRVTITNYERLHLFDLERFSGVVLDESSILKGKGSKTRAFLTDRFAATPFRLACTATPAPNDYTELGNHAEFLGLMSQQEMLTRWFIHDSANTADWRLKGHAVRPFWEWVSSWAACVSKPSDLGYDDGAYALPPLHITTHTVTPPQSDCFADGMLFHIADSTSATDLHKDKRKTVQDRVGVVAEMVNQSNEPWIVWCESNQESEMLAKAIPDAVEVKGADSIDAKEERLMAFTDGKARVIVSKPSICGFGMNWQHCRNIAFASISYSYEQFYQAVRRSWRFGQTREVRVHVVIADSEVPVWRAIERKATDHEAMKEHMKYATFTKGVEHKVKLDYNPTCNASLPEWLR